MSQMVFYKYPLDESEVYDGSPIGSTYAYGIANTELFDTVPDDVEIVLDDETSDWYALSNGTVVSGPYASVDEAFESIASTYGADDWTESDEGYDEAQSELTVASFDGLPVTAGEIYAARTEYGVDVDVRTRTVAGRRADIARWRMDMAERTRTASTGGASTRTAAQAGWLQLEPDLWEYQDGREQAYIMDANDGLLHLYYEGLDYGPYEDEYMAMEVFSTILPPIDEAIDRALAIDPGDRPYIDGDNTGNEMLDDDWEDDFDPDDEWGFHDVSDLDDDYDDEGDEDGRTASVHTAYLSARDIKDLFSGIDGVDVHDGTVSYGGREYDADELYDDMSALYDEEEVSPNAQPFDDYLRENLTDWLDAKAASSTASVHTAGAWTIDADAPLNNDQRRMLNDAGVAFSQDETDDGKARITLTGTDKVVADTAEMIGLTDDFVNDAEPLSDDIESDETPEEETRRDIEDAVESDDMRELSDEDQQRIIDGVADLLEGWKEDVADRSAAKTAEAPGADGTDVSELPVDEDWPYVLNSRKVDVDNGRYVSTHEASSDGHGYDGDDHDESTKEASVRMAADSYYDEDLGGYPLAVDEDGGETEFDNRREFEDGPLDSYYYTVFDRYGDPRKDFIDGIDEALNGAATLDITYPEAKDKNIYLSTYGDVFDCSECDKRFRSMDEAMSHLREESRRALGDVDSGRTASARTAHQLQSFSINTENHGPVTVDVDMGQQYDNGSTSYTVSIDGIPSAKNGFELSYYGYLSNDTVDDDYEEWSWSVSGSDGETIYDDGRELSGEADSREDAESDMYDAMFDYFNRNLERDIDSYLSDNGLTASGRDTDRKADANRSDRRSEWGDEYSDPKYEVLSQTEAVDYMIESSGRPLQAIRRDGETYVLPAGDAVDEYDVQVAIVAGDEHAVIQWTRTEDDGIDGAFYIEMNPVPCTHENLNRCLRWFESDPSARPDGTLFS